VAPPTPTSRETSRETSKEASKDAVRGALLRAAHDLLASEGPVALTVRRIATVAGVSTMNVYSRFGGKDGVVDALFVDGFRRMADQMAAGPATDDPLADLRECGQAYRRFARENPTYYELMFDRPIAEFVPSPEAQTEALGALGRVVERVQRAMDAGVLRAGDPFEVATALWACDHGLASLAAKTAVVEEQMFDWDRVAQLALDAMLAGFAAP
jgi:AcrR family transcriptional regulator